MARNDNQTPLAPSMSRTKIQLETSYAPGSLFTFEGNLVVCEALPKDQYPAANLTQYAETQILNGIEERVVAWYEAAMRSENNPQPFMCVDRALLNDDESQLKDTFRQRVFGFTEPDKMGYTPTLLTMVCNRCKRVKTFSSLNDMSSRKDELSQSNCQNTEHAGECTWRQMDIIFVHPNGNYKAPEPWIYDYDLASSGVTRRKIRCPRCGETDVCLDEKSAQIGKRYYYCANRKCKLKRDERWLQNDVEWLNHFRADSRHFVQDIRMKPISYRSNSVHYPMQDMIIDFGKSELLTVLNDATSTALTRAIANHFDFPIHEPDQEMVKRAIIEVRGEKEWNEYESLLSSRDMQEKVKDTLPKDAQEAMDAGIAALDKQANEMHAGWQNDGLFPSVAQIPSNLLENLLNRRERFSGRYDPFRLLIEHNTLLERIVSDKHMENGMRYFTQMDRLDEYIGPDDEVERNALNHKHRRIMDDIGVDTIGLVRKFETMQYSFGYTRVASAPTTNYINNREVPVRLKLFPRTRIDDQLKHPVFVLKQNNEAIYVRLNEMAVREWLKRINTVETITDDPIGQQYMEHVPPMGPFLDALPGADLSAPSMALSVYTLLHTYAHHLMMAISEFSGLGVGSLSEYLFPSELAFIVYRRGMTMDLGNLTSMLRNNAPAFLKYLEERRNLGCGSGSLCLSRGGACPDCLLIPEVSCLTQNKLLSRTVLIGKDHPHNYGFNQPIEGFLDVAQELAQP